MTVRVHLEPMTREEYDAYRVTAEESYAASILDSGAMAEPDARAKSAEDLARLLPDGIDTEGQLFLTARDGDLVVGMLWLSLSATPRGLTAFGYDFQIKDDLRRQGYGRAFMLAAEKECRDRGVVSIGLHVFGHNIAARTLYEQMGFHITGISMSRTL
jgi:GNAT superfamily N-acetyltransferase